MQYHEILIFAVLYKSIIAGKFFVKNWIIMIEIEICELDKCSFFSAHITQIHFLFITDTMGISFSYYNNLKLFFYFFISSTLTCFWFSLILSGNAEVTSCCTIIKCYVKENKFAWKVISLYSEICDNFDNYVFVQTKKDTVMLIC